MANEDNNTNFVDLSEFLGNETKLGYGDFDVQETTCINILLVGRSQTGKSTIVELLKHPQKGTTGRGFSDTKEPKVVRTTITEKGSSKIYNVNILDTPGLQEVGSENQDSRNDEELMKLNVNALESNVVSLNMVCFVSKAGETHRLDTEVFQKIKSYLGEVCSSISMMILTHCESISDEKLQSYKRDIQNHPRSKELYEFCKLGLFFTGAIDPDHLTDLPDDTKCEVIKVRLRRTQNLRNKFLSEVIRSAENSVPVKELEEMRERLRMFCEEIAKEALEAKEAKELALNTKVEQIESSKTKGCRVM